jgi:hypothetical protein
MASLDHTAKTIQSLSTAGTQTMAELDATLSHIDTAVLENDKALRVLMSDIGASIQHIDSLLMSGNRFLEGTHKDTFQLLLQLKNMLRHYEKAGKHLNRFLEQIADQPSQLIFGGPVEEGDLAGE